MNPPAVQDSAELRRIVAIPRRTWTPDQTAELVRALTEALRVPRLSAEPVRVKCLACGALPGELHRPLTLRPLQAIALAEIAQWGGVFAPLPVGQGKTTISALAPRMRPERVRPLVLVPAHLRAKTDADFHALRSHWVLPPFLRVESYQTLSRVGAAEFLGKEYRPDMIIADEGDYLKNPQAAVTRRVSRYLEHHYNAGTRVVYVDLTGTPGDTSIKEYTHRASWALPHTNPTPETHGALDEWSRALDVDVHAIKRMTEGALSALKSSPLEDVRAAYQRRLHDSPGVVMTRAPQIPISITVTSHVIPLDTAQADAFELLRSRWKTPDEIDAPDGIAVWRHARELASGFYSVWDPRPPTEWAEARSSWARACRETISSNRRQIDSAEQLTIAMLQHRDWYPEALATYEAWKEIEPSFVPNPVPYWISDQATDWIAAWAAEGPGLIWTDRPALGQRLAQRFGLPFYWNEGVDPLTGRTIESHDPRTGSAVLARKANDSGRNLQAWSRNLIVDIPKSGRGWEQLVGRTHRPGQTAPRIVVDLLFGCIEDVSAFWSARARAQWSQDMTGQPQKLVHADLSAVLDVDTAEDMPGARWVKTKPPESP